MFRRAFIDSREIYTRKKREDRKITNRSFRLACLPELEPSQHSHPTLTSTL